MKEVTVSTPASTLTPDPRADYYDREELVRRGWTRSLRRALGAADAHTKSTRFDIAHPLWLRSSAESMEATVEWQEYRRCVDLAILQQHGRNMAAIRAERQGKAALA